MGEAKFQFKNKEYYQSSKRRVFLSENWIKKFLVLSSCTVFFIFFVLKILWSFDFNKRLSHFKFSKPSLEKTRFEKTHRLPLLVNLKGKKGPQLVRLEVYIAFNENSLEKGFLLQDEEFEKHLLFILSGQEIETLQKKKNYFEQQIRSQLNVFLSKDVVNGVHIQTEDLMEQG